MADFHLFHLYLHIPINKWKSITIIMICEVEESIDTYNKNIEIVKIDSWVSEPSLNQSLD